MNEAELRCPVSRRCGGCALIELPYAAQLERKQALVREALDAHEALRALPLSECMAAPHRAAYRNRAKLAVDGSSGAVRIGLFRRGSHELVDLAPCRVQLPSLMRGLELLRGWIAEARLASPQGPLFYVDLRRTAGEGCHLTLVADRRRELPPEWPLDSLIERWPELSGVALNLGDPTSSFVMASESRTLHGEASFCMTVGEPPLEFELPAGGFFQLSVELLPALHEAIARHFSGSARILDFYCGVGLHGIAVGLRMADSPPELRGIDSSAALVEAARRNATRHGIAADFEVGTVEQRIGDLDGQQAAVLLNPGRSGCRPPVLDALAAGDATRVAYLSCSPRSLARDLAALLSAGFEVDRLQPVDLMPQTDQVETLALLRRGR